METNIKKTIIVHLKHIFNGKNASTLMLWGVGVPWGDSSGSLKHRHFWSVDAFGPKLISCSFFLTY